MIKWIEATGKNEEAAVAAALRQLGMDRDSVSVEVLERAKSGFLGIGGSPAKVKVSYEAPDEQPVSPVIPAPEKKPEPEKVEKPQKEQKPEPSRKPQQIQKAAEEEDEFDDEDDELDEGEEELITPGEKKDVEERIRSFLGGLLEQMKISAELRIEKRPEGGYLVVLEGEKLGALIGHRGETLDAIQQLTNYTVNRGRARRVRIHVDVENYRAKREESLRRLANKVAAKVVKYRRNVTLEPMNAYERHVIHEALQDYPDVITYSTGVEPNRRTVVAYSRGKHPY